MRGATHPTSAERLPFPGRTHDYTLACTRQIFRLPWRGHLTGPVRRTVASELPTGGAAWSLIGGWQGTKVQTYANNNVSGNVTAGTASSTLALQ